MPVRCGSNAHGPVALRPARAGPSSACSPDAGTPVAPCLVLGDIDNFQQLRQTLDDTQLTDVVHQVAKVVRSVAQSHHVAVRLEDHAFALLMPGAGLHEAHLLAEQWRHGAGQVGQVGLDAALRVSLSVG
ncbi:diguanylate cyclase, partial [Klebsiella pneumoniae]|nr:diguanylate cyclase [Klebsiella pneumoniae]